MPSYTAVWSVLLQIAHLSKNQDETYVCNSLQCKIRYPDRLKGYFASSGCISDFINFYHANHPCTCATIWLTALCCHGFATALKCLLNYVHLTYVVYIATGRAVA